ncbi:clan AA aspartic protease [Leptospira ognonensis]|uniref:Clan AA aspartic protease n=1 Tax=Leptospira ognonensis TaxID=2484945 RepID=A0A4R9JXD5_9LEPT|nr:clan AA aspartic protease [Leptospira ognonensis]TGL56734.1 clan AA aspartic protease [Leptospira ognonensis]
MGLAYGNLQIKNPKRTYLQPISVIALADTGLVYLIIPEHVKVQLELEEHSRKEIELADGSKQFLPYVGPIEIAFKNRIAFVGAIVMGNEVLLGAIPMEDVDLIVISKDRRVDVNPENPNFAAAKAK